VAQSRCNSVGKKLELLRHFGLSLGDVYNLNRLAIQASEMSMVSSGLSVPEVKVGAAVMTSLGNMYQGSNMEPAPFAQAYGTALSAEECALFKALSEGQREIKAIALHVKHLEISTTSGVQGAIGSSGLN
jgi:cytidine deaminase